MTEDISNPQARPAPPRPAAGSGNWPTMRKVDLGSDGSKTPLAENDNIQGNVLAGFSKDHQMLLFMNLATITAGRAWLAELRPRLATNKAVAGFNRRFSAAHRESGGDPEDLAALWTNVSFTAAGMQLLAPAAIKALNDLKPDAGLDAGVHLWLAGAGDPGLIKRVGDVGTSAPEGWLFGKPEQAIHAVVCIAADRPDDLNTEIAKQRSIAARLGVSIVFEQPGETLPGAAAGHEHFGFKDGISQPGVFGFDPPSTEKAHKGEVAGKHGTDLLAAGNFVLGYPRDPVADTKQPVAVNVPKWMFDGSFLVTRRLAQDVAGFWANAESAHASLPAEAKCPVSGIPSPDALAAKLVGRWRSGTPVAAAPLADNRSAHDPDDDNAFGFEDDEQGETTPFVAHIRKVYPREGGTKAKISVTEDETKPRRILRRGIPFGLPFQPTGGRGAGVDGDRGLVFQCYQASLADQFTFLQQVWINLGLFPDPDTGNDSVIGLASDKVTIKACGAAQTIGFGQFVHTQGSLFALTPSLETVDKLAAGQPLSIN
ncbi:MAG: peroxidase [Pseudonocardiales bacterium]|nr:peroxidase [Pseudonocardiales bacterium]